MPNNNDLDPAASTQMFQAFVEGRTPNAPTPVEQPTKARSVGLGKVLGPILIVAVIVVLAAVVLH